MDLYLVVFLFSAIVIGIYLGQRYKRTNTTSSFKGDEKSSRNGRTSGTSTPPAITPLPAFDYKSINPTQFRPYKPTYHITMALQSSSPEDLIILDNNYKDRIETRRKVMDSNRDTVIGTIGTQDAKAAVDELYLYLMNFLPQRYPSVFTMAATNPGAASLQNNVTGNTISCSPPSDPVDALRTLGETIEDDLFLLKEEDIQSVPDDSGPAYPDTSHRLVAFLCCFPSGFDPSSKLGLLLKDIHKPVPSYDKIGPSMERFFKRLTVGQSWSVQTHTELFVPKGNHVHEGDKVEHDADVDVSQTCFRVECQTLTRLPVTNAILFSFKTYLFPLQNLKNEGVGPDLADAIEGLKEGNAPGMWTYKGGVRWGKSVCEYLRS